MNFNRKLVKKIVVLFSAFFLISLNTAGAQIANDECSSAMVISSLPFSVSQNTRLASPNASDPALTCQDSIQNGKTVWFKFTPDTTRFVVFSTLGSEPMADYDIIMSLFVGSCGNLSEVKCNDDTLDTRQSAFGFNVVAGTTYYLMIGEWGGGGTYGGTPTGGDLLLNVYAPILPPLVKGPKKGTVNNGVITNTDNFPAVAEIPLSRPKLKKPNINKRIAKLPPPESMVEPLASYGSNYYADRSVESDANSGATISRPVALESFEGIPQTNYIPPDPILAVGPDHVMIAVNSTFRIFDKSGSILKTIDADAWFDQVLSGASTFDPILMYDHFDQRWIFVMLHVVDAQKKAYIFLGISDDSNPLGFWYNWAMPAHVIGDSTVSNWTDYARVGFDEDAIYITGNQFGFTTDFAYSKLRIVPKPQLYENSGHAIQWYDFWDFRDPDNLNNVIFGLRPSITFGNPGKQFLLNDSPYFLGTFFTLWTVDSAVSSPSITAADVPVVQYFPSPDADQLDGSSIPIEAFGADIRNEPFYKDSALWAVHAVASGPNKQYSAVRYLKFDPFLKQTKEDVSFGLDGYWHSYPAMMLNDRGDLTITFSRSGVSEYIGAFMTGRKKNDPPGLSPSVALREGRGNYVVDYGVGRNRWGDYNGIGLDPSDGVSVWIHTEFAAAKNKWGTWVAKTQLGPVPGSKLTTDRTYINFGTKNVGSSSDTITITLTNDGTEDLYISVLTKTSKHFRFVNEPQLPIIIPSLGTYPLRVYFSPDSTGYLSDSILYCAAQACFTTSTLTVLTGTGFHITPARKGTLYAASGSTDGGKLYQIHSGSGNLSFIAHSGLGQVTSLRVHPATKELIGLDPTGGLEGGYLYKISATGSSVRYLTNVRVTNLKGLTFVDDSIAYMADFNGRIFRVNIYNGSYTQIASTALRVGGLALNPIDGTLWFCLRATSGILDGIYKINLTTKAVTMVGRTGVGISNSDLLFDKNGTLYVLAGINTAQNKLLTVDTANGQAVKILDLGASNITSIALNPDDIADASGNKSLLPDDYTLLQNYPNPFNPLTAIEFTVPKRSFVTLIVYDALGRIIQTLAEGFREKGFHREYYDASGVSSGVYYYTLRSGTYHSTKKMIVIK